LRAAALERYGLEGEVLGACQGAALALVKFRHPFYDRASPVYLGDYVTLDAGTGIVHSAPAYGLEDFDSCRKHGMHNDEILTPVQGDGVFASKPALLRRHVRLEGQCGHHRKAGRDRLPVRQQRDRAQLHALLAAQDADHLSRHDAMVCGMERIPIHATAVAPFPRKGAMISGRATRRWPQSRRPSSIPTGARRGCTR
jgi:hypothetical protein